MGDTYDPSLLVGTVALVRMVALSMTPPKMGVGAMVSSSISTAGSVRVSAPEDGIGRLDATMRRGCGSVEAICVWLGVVNLNDDWVGRIRA